MTTEDILAMLRDGDSIEDIGNHFAKLMNEAKSQYDQEQKNKEEEKLSRLTDIMDSLINWIDEYVAPVPEEINGETYAKELIDTFNSVDYIACEDTRNSINLLRYLGINKKLVAYHKFNEKGKSNTIIEDLKAGKNIGLISDAGCPCISDPGSILVSEAIDNGIEVISIPGPSAVITSLMSSGLDTSTFTFYGFFPRENKETISLCNTIKKDSSKLGIIYESPKRIMKTLEVLLSNLGDIKICLSNDLTKKFEKKYYGIISKVISELKDNPNYEKGEYVLIIEPVKEMSKTSEKSIESLIIDEMIYNKCTMKEAIKLVSEKYDISKNNVYQASLNLKRILDVNK